MTLTPAQVKLLKLAIQGVVALAGSALIGGIVKVERSTSEKFDEYIDSKTSKKDVPNLQDI